MEPYFMMMLVGGAVMVVFGVVAILNFASMFGSLHKDGIKKNNIMVHFLAPFIAGLGSLSLVGGFIWFILEKYVK